MVKFLKHSVKPLDQSQIQTVAAHFELKVVQQPVKARVAGRKQTRNSSRRLVDPQPVVEIRLNEDHSSEFHQPNNIIDHNLSMFFVRASIECLGSNDKGSFFQKQRKSRFFEKTEDDGDVLRGTTTVSAQFYRGSPYTACAVFDNLSVRYKGNYRLKFDLFEIQSFSNGSCIIPKIIQWQKATSYSSVFTVYTDAAFDGLEASPELNNELKKAGCKIRSRKQKNGNSMVDLDGFRVNKKFTYNNGQFKYAFSGTNHFGLDQSVFNRPGTSVDFAMFQNFQNAAIAANMAQNNPASSNSQFNMSPSTNQAAMNPKRPQSALPQLITSGDQFNFNHSYDDMLKSTMTSATDYKQHSGSPIEQPQPRRAFNTNTAINGPMSAQLSTPNPMYPDFLATLQHNTNASPSHNSTSSPPDEFLSPVVYPSANNNLMEANGINNRNSLFAMSSFNDQYSLNARTSIMSMMMGDNMTVSDAQHQNQQQNNAEGPKNGPNTIGLGLNPHVGAVPDPILANGEIPRSTLPLEPIPMFWDFEESNNTTSVASMGPESSESAGHLTQQQQTQLLNFQAQIELQNHNHAGNPSLLVDNSNSNLQQSNQVQISEFQPELLNFNDIYQQSEMLLRQNFEM